MNKKKKNKTTYKPIDEKILVENRIETLRPHQKKAFNKMQNTNILQLRYPCSFGKGYLMITDLMQQHIIGNDKISVICSHRLGLNDQHAKEIFNSFKPLVGKVAFLFLGSKGGLRESKVAENDNNKFRRLLNQYNNYNNFPTKDRLSFTNLVKTEINAKKAKDFIKDHISHNRKVIVISTYNSIHKLSGIDIDTIYCDEAHELAANSFQSNNPESFINKYKSLICKRRFFFTATPKMSSDNDDLQDDPIESCLMSNKILFGEIIGMSNKEALSNGYSLPIDSSKITPEFFDLEHGVDYSSYENKAKLISKAFFKHKERLKEESAFPNLINPIMLVRTSSVETELWPIFNTLEMLGLQNVRIFGCASKGRNGNTEKGEISYLEGEGITEYDTREEFIDAINNCEGDAIVLHHDTLSEGINIHKFTCFMPFTEKTMTRTKFIQNLGRILRLDPFDRKRLDSGKISVGSKGWKKPKAHIIMPVFSIASNEACEFHTDILYKLENSDTIGIGNSILIGDDMATGFNEDFENLNQDEITDKSNNIISEVIFETIDLKKWNDEKNKKRIEFFKLIKKETEPGNFRSEEFSKFLNDFIL